MKAVRAKRAWRAAALVSGLFLAWAASPAFGLSIDPHAGCDELCSEKFWVGASGKDVAAALDKKPAALGYLRTMLRLAVKAGNAGAAEALLRAGAPPNAQEQPGRYDYMLHEAARRSGELVSVLLKAGAFPDVVNEEGRTPLHEAVISGPLSAVVALLPEAGAGSPCGRLCEAGFWKTATREQVRSALAQAPAAARRSAPGGGPLHLALATGADVETVKLLLDHGMDLNGRDIRGDTPLHVAARTPGGAGSVSLLLERGAMRDALNARDWTPLHAASERASTLDAMRVLLDAGADPDTLDGNSLGVTPRHLAVLQPEGPEAASLILGYRGSGEASPRKLPSLLLHSAARSGHPDTVALLLSRGANADDLNTFFNTPLLGASYSGNLDTMRVLLRHGANPSFSKYDGIAPISGEGERPLHAAVRHPAAVKLLLESGADPDGRMLRGETPLHHAASICAGKSLALLLAHGANPNLWDEYGDTPLHDAVRRVAVSKDSGRIRRDWLASCEKEEKENQPGWEECRARISKNFKEEFEAREECVTNIATLIKFGADPGIVSTKIGTAGGVTPLDMAKRHDLDDSIIGLMEEALNQNNR